MKTLVRSLRDLIFIFHILLISQTAVCQDCNGVYYNFQCHTFGLDGQTWAVAEDKCSQRYTVSGFTGAHLTTIGSPEKQANIEEFMDRFGMRGAWVGATKRPLLWQWLTSSQVLQAQGCYDDNQTERVFTYRAQIAGLSVEGCIDACHQAGFGYGFAGIQNRDSCVCGHTLDSRTLAVGCTSPCLRSTSLSKWCGGSGLLTTVYKIGGANGVWGYNQPDMIPSQKSCAVLDMNLETKMADENCSLRYDYLCQLNTSTCSGPGYQQISHLCYYVSSADAVAWETARDKCRRNFNGELATVDNSFLQAAIRQWFSNVFPNEKRKIWIGAFKGGWFWLSGYSFAYTNWASGEPKDSTGDQCLFVDQTLNYTWLALPCTESKSFICQRGYDTFTTPAFNWVGPTPPDTGNTGSTGGTGGTGNTGGTGGTGGTGSTGTTGGTGSTGSTFGTGSTGGTGGTMSRSTTASFLSDPTANYTNPETGAKMDEMKRGWSDLAIGLFALLAILLFLGLLLCLICLALCLAKNRSVNKVGYEHHYDARPIAHIPNSGEYYSSTTSLKRAAEPVGTS